MRSKLTRAKLSVVVSAAALCSISVAWVLRDWLAAPVVATFTRLDDNAQGYAEYRHDSTGIVFVLLPGGDFMMGGNEGEVEAIEPRFATDPANSATWENYERPRHVVTLSPFLIAKYELTQAAWVKVMGENPSRLQGDELPVETVSWHDCKEFCRRTGLELPSEAQWEYACRAGTTTPFAFGETVSMEQVNYNASWPKYSVSRGRYRGTTVPVDAFQPNAFGLYQMHGNVKEWCEDLHDWGFYSSSEARGPNPICTSRFVSDYREPWHRVVRGGSYREYVTECRSAARDMSIPAIGHSGRGFRPIAPAPP